MLFSSEKFILIYFLLGLLIEVTLADDSIPLEILTCGPKIAELRVTLPDTNEQTYHIWYSEEGRPFRLGPEVPYSGFNGEESDKVSVGVKPWRVYQFVALPTGDEAPQIMGSQSRRRQGCRAAAQPPEVNPNNLCVPLGPNAGYLYITWDDVPLEDRYGPDFAYFVSYRKHGSQNYWRTFKSYRNQYRVEYAGRPLDQFDVKVWAGNSAGNSTAPPSTATGFAGEYVPSVVPEEFQMLSALNDTTALFSWSAVNESTAVIKGFFCGYKVKFWRLDDPHQKEARTEDIILEEYPVDQCSEDVGRVMRRRELDQQWKPTVFAVIGQLWPSVLLNVSVAAMNVYHVGHWSVPITVTTAETYDIVPFLKILETGSSHIVIRWLTEEEILDKPANPSSTGFLIEWHSVESPDESAGSIQVAASKRRWKIMDLQDDKQYEITIYPLSGQDKGLKNSATAKTNSRNIMIDEVRILHEQTGTGWFNITFRPYSGEESSNPGAYFVLKYARYDELFIERFPLPDIELDPQSTDYWFYVDGLESGYYSYQIEAISGSGSRKSFRPTDPNGFYVQ